MLFSDLRHQLIKYRETVLLILILLVAFYIRQFRLHELMTFTYDQGRDMYVLQSISRGDVTLIGPTTGLPGVFLGPFYYYALLPGFILSGGSPFGVATWQTIFILATFPLLYFHLKPVIGRRWAFLALAAMVFTPGAIYQARTIWNPSLVVPTLLVTFYALAKTRHQPWWLLLSYFAYGLSLQTELAYTVFLAPVLALWTIYFMRLPVPFPTFWQRAESKIEIKHFVLAVCAFGLTLTPQLLFEVRNNFLITTSFIREFSDTTKQVPYSQIWQERPAQIVAALSDTLTANAPLTGLLIAATVAASIFVGVTMRRKPEIWIWLGYCWLPLILLLFHRGNGGAFYDYYINAHYLPMLAVLFLAFYQLGRSFSVLHKPLMAIVVLIWASIFIRFVQIHFNVANFQYTTATQISALEHARQLGANDSMPIEVFVPNLVPVTYQYLNEWMAQTGQATPVKFGITAEKSYILLSEPIISDGSKVAYEQWQKYWVEPAKCKETKKIGITEVRRCEKSGE